MPHLARLNGWQRIWFVVAAFTLIYAIGWGILEGATGGGQRVRQEVLDGFSHPACKPVLQMQAQTALSPELEGPCWDLYLYRSIYENAATTAEGYRNDIGSRRRDWMLGTIGIALFLWLVGCGALYFAGWTLAWIRRGFKTGADTK